MRWSVLMLSHLVMAVDIVLLLGTAGLAGSPSASSTLLPNWFQTAIAAALMTMLIHWLLVQFDSYSLDRLRSHIRTIIDLVVAILLTLVLAACIATLFGRPETQDWEWLGLWAMWSIGGLAIWRQIVRQIANRGLRSGSLLRNVAIIGATAAAEIVIRELSDPSIPAPCRIIGIFDDRGAERRLSMIGNHTVSGTVDTLCSYAEANSVDLIVIALPWTRAAAIWAMIQRVQWISADVIIPADPETFNPRVAQMIAVGGAGGQPALQVMRQPLQGARVLVKMIEDYAVGILAVIIVAPVMALVALAIRMDSPGPVFFRQPRIGFNHRIFNIYKFRTMVVNTDDTGIVGVGRNDPRITRVGAILRQLSLDELPQLFNVLRGEMSVVGPRPHVPGMKVGDEDYTRAVSDYAARYRIKPGITGWAQINGMRGGIHTVEKARRGVDLDMYYIENWSIWLDIRIMLRTLFIGMAGHDVF